MLSHCPQGWEQDCCPPLSGISRDMPIVGDRSYSPRVLVSAARQPIGRMMISLRERINKSEHNCWHATDMILAWSWAEQVATLSQHCNHQMILSSDLVTGTMVPYNDPLCRAWGTTGVPGHHNGACQYCAGDNNDVCCITSPSPVSLMRADVLRCQQG